MEIRINNETVDFTLEHEKVLGEVVDGIGEWLAINGFTMTSIRKDSKNLKLGERLEWQDDPIEEISSIDITALHPTDLTVEKLTAAIQYLDLIKEEGDLASPVVADLLKGVDDVSQMIDDAVLSERTGDDTFGSRFKALAYATGILSGNTSTERFDDFLNYVSELEVVLRSRFRELTDPVTELRACVPLLRQVLEQTGDIAVLLQTGEDAKAIGQIIRFLEVSQKMLRLIHNLGEQAVVDLPGLTVDGVPVGEFAAGLNGYLIELSEAIEAGDTVLTGDLLEYEIGPRLNALLTELENSGAV